MHRDEPSCCPPTYASGLFVGGHHGSVPEPRNPLPLVAGNLHAGGTMHPRQFLAGLMAASAPMAITRTVVAQPMPPGTMSAAQYLTMASTGGMFLEETSRDAYEKTQNPRVRRFARAEVVEQVNLSAKLNARSGGVPQAGMAPGGPVGGLVAAPFVAAGAVVGGTVGAAGA